MTENRYKTMLENYRKEETQFYYMTLLENILLSMFTYVNLPNGLTTEYIEKSLLRYGNVLLTKVSDTEFYGNYVVYQGSLDNNGIMEQGFTTTRNGKQTDTKQLYYRKSLEYKDNSNVLIFNNSEHLPTFDLCRISELLTEVYISMRNNVINTRILPIPVARNSKMKSMIDNILNKLHSGKTEAIVNDLSTNDAMNILLNKADVKSTFDIPVLNLTQPNNVELLQNLTKFYDDIIRIFCTTYGISINGTGKMAQQNNIELQGYEHFSKIIPCDMLNCRKTGIEIFNAIHGTNVEVSFSEAWKHLLTENENVSRETTENENGVMIMLIKDIFKLISEDSVNRSFLPLTVDVVTRDYYAQYKDAHFDIDNILNNDYGDYNIANIDNDAEWESISDTLCKNFKLFTFKHKITVDKLFEIDAITFNPIHNFDKTVRSTNVKTGESVSQNVKDGAETNTTTLSKVGTENNTSVQSGGMSTNDTLTEETTTLNSDTAYNTNLVNSNKVTTNSSPTSTTTYNDLTTSNTLSFEGRQDTNINRLEFDNRRDTDTTTYNDITDTYTETTQGNIGVTTSTEMLSEYTQFYYSYSFWWLFWILYITDFCDYYF